MKPLILFPVICLLTACVGYVKPPPAYPNEYLSACKSPSVLADGKHATVEVWAINTVIDARECAETHSKLVDAVKRRDAVYK